MRTLRKCGHAQMRKLRKCGHAQMRSRANAHTRKCAHARVPEILADPKAGRRARFQPADESNVLRTKYSARFTHKYIKELSLFSLPGTSCSTPPYPGETSARSVSGRQESLFARLRFSSFADYVSTLRRARARCPCLVS